MDEFWTKLDWISKNMTPKQLMEVVDEIMESSKITQLEKQIAEKMHEYDSIIEANELAEDNAREEYEGILFPYLREKLLEVDWKWENELVGMPRLVSSELAFSAKVWDGRELSMNDIFGSQNGMCTNLSGYELSKDRMKFYLKQHPARSNPWNLRLPE